MVKIGGEIIVYPRKETTLMSPIFQIKSKHGNTDVGSLGTFSFMKVD